MSGEGPQSVLSADWEMVRLVLASLLAASIPWVWIHFASRSAVRFPDEGAGLAMGYVLGVIGAGFGFKASMREAGQPLLLRLAARGALLIGLGALWTWASMHSWSSLE